jgi:Fe-S cluster assembly protein SufD
MSIAPTPLDIVRAKGIPHRRMEDWKYSDLRAVLDADALEQGGSAIMALSLPAGIKQAFLRHGELPEWASRRSGPPSRSHAMDAAARAFDPNGMALFVPREFHDDQPLGLEFDGAGHGEILLVLESGATLTLVETHTGADAGLRNISLSVFLGEGARLSHIRQAQCSGPLVVVETMMIHAAAGAHYAARLAGRGARLSRTEIDITLAGEGAGADLSGAIVLSGDAHSDITTRIDHAVGHTTSRQLFKLVASGNSRAIYQGKITVGEGANGSDSRQTAKALLLGAGAEADLKPELEIFADDVKCAHGAAVGDLDADSLFYLRARGISETEARALLIRGFLGEVIDEIADAGQRAAAWELVEDGLGAALKDSP